MAGTDSQHRADNAAGAVAATVPLVDRRPHLRRRRGRRRCWPSACSISAGRISRHLPGALRRRPRRPAGGQSVPGAASAEVNAACVRVINEAHDVSVILSEVGPAASEVDLQQLDDIVRRLQSIQPRR